MSHMDMPMRWLMRCVTYTEVDAHCDKLARLASYC